MEDNMGSSTNPAEEYYKDLSKLADDAHRFCEPPDQATSNAQLIDRDRVMRQVGEFADFRPTTEKDLEDYVDSHARKIKSRHTCVELFKELWAAASNEAVATTIHNCTATDYETLVSDVALKLFPHSRY
ncbi:MAG: hypothetical protein KVP17_004962, partial [Porospora cf. gigantea B]|uniref:uncharacterized protein n=1 Tax=Porospora cf. gigantea B TaxID=2853592 RepID=UPI003571B495